MVTNGVRKININNYIDLLMNIELFRSFSSGQIQKLFNLSKYKLQKYEKGQIIHIQNELCESMEIILQGKASVQKIDQEGNILRVAVFSDGDILGVNLMFSDRNYYPMTVVSESNLILLSIYRDLILELSHNNTEFMMGLLGVISNKTLLLTDKIDAISLKTIREKIKDFLKYEFYLQASKTIRLNISKKELAEKLGVQRTSLSRELNKMRKDGLIDFDAKTITIKDYDEFLDKQ